MRMRILAPAPSNRRGRFRTATAVAAAAAATVSTLAVGALISGASVEIGTGGKDVLTGADNDNAANTDIQPDGVTAKQHLDNTDLLKGKAGRDLLIGRTGSDVLLGDDGNDIEIGGLEGGTAPIPNSDVMLGQGGNDINIWAPGDGSELFDAGTGKDTIILSQVVNTALDVTLFDFNGRQIPRVTIDNRPQFTCTIERSPAIDGLNVDAVVRFFANGNLAVTIRLLGVEQVLCPSPNVGTVNVANIGEGEDEFVEVPLGDFGGVLGAILSGTE
jgi:RTX calcium-binding nonapeptide repeat (4 copies)